MRPCRILSWNVRVPKLRNFNRCCLVATINAIDLAHLRRHLSLLGANKRATRGDRRGRYLYLVASEKKNNTHDRRHKTPQSNPMLAPNKYATTNIATTKKLRDFMPYAIALRPNTYRNTFQLRCACVIRMHICTLICTRAHTREISCTRTSWPPDCDYFDGGSAHFVQSVCQHYYSHNQQAALGHII